MLDGGAGGVASLRRAVALAALICNALAAQDEKPLEFEAASVRPAPIRVDRGKVVSGGPGTPDPGQIVYTGLSLRALIFMAYNVRPYQLTAPSWMSEDSFDIVAKVPPGANRQDVATMLRNLLTDRFRLKVRREERPTSAYALTVAAGGPKMRAYPLELPDGFVEKAPPHYGLDQDGMFTIPEGFANSIMMTRNGATRIAVARQPLGNLCDLLSRALQRPVVDQTGLTGRFDAVLTFAADTAVPASGPGVESGGSPSYGASVFGALQSQLGLKLEPKRLPVEFLVVESAEKMPIEN
jgi:uncharacterized protein (TIGR03435 family)